MDFNEYLNKLGLELTDRLVKDIQTKRVTKYGAVNASGRLAKSVRYDVKNSTLTVYAEQYIGALEFGRKPTTNGNKPGKLKDVIRQWIDEKGITPKDGISKDSLAFLITRKIHREGTTIWQQGGSDLVSGIFNDALTKEIENDFYNLIASEVSSDVLKIAA
jgi:hypothetical protein